MGSKEKIFQSENGMEWLRADFHLHTVADKEFEKYPGYEKSNFTERYVEALKKENIRIGVITNHNKFDKDEYEELHRAAKEEGIWIVPGTELSVNDGSGGIHCLIVFDEDSWVYNKENENYIGHFLGSAFEGIPNRENGNGLCNYNLKGLLEKLDYYRKQGRDSFVVLAHVEQSSGFLDGFKERRIQDIISRDDLFKNSVLAMQKIRTRDEIKNLKSWFGGGSLPAFVEGSDCKSIGGVGRAPIQNGKEMKTYVKIGDSNFEALKYALSDHENRIKDQDTLPPARKSYVKSVRFEGGKFDGQTIGFSPELNSLIGIRGSGKSAIIESIRYALNISLSSSSSADVPYKNQLVSYVLGSGGKIVVSVVDKYGKEYRIEKIIKEKNSEEKEKIYDENNNVMDCSVETILDNLVYFGQKDLSDKNDAFESDLLKKFVGVALKDVSNRISNKEQDIKNLVLELKKSRDLEASKKGLKNTINSVNQSLSYFKEKGVVEKLRLQTQFDSDLILLRDNKKAFQKYLDEIGTIIQDYKAFFSGNIGGSGANNEIINEANEALKKAKLEFDKLQSIRDNTVGALDGYNSAISKLEKKSQEMQEEFAKIRRELNSDDLNPDVFISLSRTQKTSNLQLQEIERLEKIRTEHKSKLLDEIAALNKLWEEEYGILEREAKKIASRNLSIKVVFKGQRHKFLEKLQEVFKGTGIREYAYQAISEGYDDFTDIYRNRDKIGEIVTENQIAYFNERFEEYLGELLTYKIDNKVIIEYKGKSLDKHSLGQRASALILFLLSQENTNVLIIDQPEDDLDNQTIYDEVIKELVKLKGKMQFIFATHNANIPVLGDSEKVIVCNLGNPGKVSVDSGTIDTAETQKSVIRIMEGGKDAFSKRKHIYSLWEKTKDK